MASTAKLRSDLETLLSSKNVAPLIVLVSWGFFLTDGTSRQIQASKLDSLMELMKPTFEKYCLKTNRLFGRTFGGHSEQPLDPKDVFSLALVLSIKKLGGPKISWRPGRESVHKVSSFDPVSEISNEKKSWFPHFNANERKPSSRNYNTLESKEEGKVLPEYIENLKMRLRTRECIPQQLVCLSGMKCIQIKATGILQKKRKEAASASLKNEENSSTSCDDQSVWGSEDLIFDNSYFKELLHRQWEKVHDRLGNDLFYISKDGDEVVMEPEDMALLNAQEACSWVRIYANDKERFFQDFAFFFTQLQEDDIVSAVEKSKSKGLQGTSIQKVVLGNKPGYEKNGGTVTDTAEKPSSPREYFFAEELKLFTFRAALRVHVTRTWSDICIRSPQKIMEKVERLTATAESRSLVFRKKNEQIPNGYEYDLHDPVDRIAAIAVTKYSKSGVSKYKPQYVPKFVTEEEFFSNYFSHILALRISCGVPDRRIVLVGSKNPVKLKASKLAFKDAFNEAEYEQLEFVAVSAQSLVPDQPIGDVETKQGAINRARYCYDNCGKVGVDPNQVVYTVGLEGGIQETEQGYECFAWITVFKPEQNVQSSSRTASFELPNGLVRLLRTGVELGTADDMLYKRVNAKQHDGTVGKLTKGAIDRTEYYRHCAILALAPFANPEIHSVE